jgi:hypothetical protein
MSDQTTNIPWHKPRMRMLEFDVSAGTQKFAGTFEGQVDTGADTPLAGPVHTGADFPTSAPPAPPTGPS